MDWLGPPTTVKFLKLGGSKLSPSVFIVKSIRRRSLIPSRFLLTLASKDTCAESNPDIKNVSKSICGLMFYQSFSVSTLTPFVLEAFIFSCTFFSSLFIASSKFFTCCGDSFPGCCCGFPLSSFGSLFF